MMFATNRSRAASRRMRGETGAEFVTGTILSVLLAAGIAAETVYLTKDLGWRADLTEDQLYSLSPSTDRILGKLGERLVIEAYFSQKKIPGVLAPTRRKIENLLDEYVQAGKGMVQLVYLDPLDDERIKEKASRLGVQEMKATALEGDDISQIAFYQGLRLRYGGDKQKVIPALQSDQGLESVLTPMIRELVLARKPKVGILVRAAQQQPFSRDQRPPAWDLLERQIGGRYEVARVDLAEGQILDQELDLVLVIQPKELTDWEKYSLDQHLMRGGNLIVFADIADYSVDLYNTFYQTEIKPDVAETKLAFTDQLRIYGIDWSKQLVSELYGPAVHKVFLVGQGPQGAYLKGTSPMPYCFDALAVDWASQYASLDTSKFAKPELAATFGPGLSESPIFAKMQRLGFFWPTEVDLVEPLPAEVQGAVLARTSPFGLVEGPPQKTDPQEGGLLNALTARMRIQGKQVALAATVWGKFSSAFAGRELPARPGHEKEDEAENEARPPALPGDPPGEKKGGPFWQEPTSESTAEPAQEPKPAEAEPDAAAPKQAEAQGPPGPGGTEAAEPEDELPERLDKSKAEGRIVVVGDANMIRDDYINGMLIPQPGYGAPISRLGLPFAENLIDWLVLDTDLVELRARRTTDRRLEFAKDDPSGNEKREEFKERVANVKFFYRWANILVPSVLLLAFGMFLWTKRATEKRGFLRRAITPASGD